MVSKAGDTRSGGPGGRNSKEAVAPALFYPGSHAVEFSGPGRAQGTSGFAVAYLTLLSGRGAAVRKSCVLLPKFSAFLQSAGF